MTTIYAIENIANGKVYVGSTSNTYSRWMDHKSALRRGNHHSYRLQEDWNTYGMESFNFKVIEDCVLEEERLNREQYWIDKLSSSSEELGYNISPTAGTTLGRRHREDAKIKMSATHTGKTLSDDHKEHIAKAMRAVEKTEDHQRKITEAIRSRDKSIYARGDKVARKLRRELVLEILTLLDAGFSPRELANKFDVSSGTIRCIRSGRTWKEVYKEYHLNNESEAV